MRCEKETAQALLLHVGVMVLLGTLNDLHVGCYIHMCEIHTSCDCCKLDLDNMKM